VQTFLSDPNTGKYKGKQEVLDMDSKRDKDLRRKAEKQVDDIVSAIKDLPVNDVQKMAHDLAIHQVELEIQNEELRLARNSGR
jgi:hypothetical protein